MNREVPLWSKAILGGQAGLLGGALVGLWEACVVILTTRSEEAYVLPYGVAAYGLACLAIGTGWGLAIALLRRSAARTIDREKPFAFHFAFIFCAVSLAISWIRWRRDVLEERLLTPWQILLLLAVFSALFLALYLFANRALGRAPVSLVLKPVGTGCLFLVVLAGAGVAAAILSNARQGKTITPPAFTKAQDQGTPHVILIMVDTLRADRLSSYGATSAATPSIDGLAADGILFTKAIAQASWTKPSVASLLTSLYPSRHQTFRKPDVLPDEVVTLAEVMKGAGYRTAAVVSNIHLSPLFNLNQGYDEYDYLGPDYFFYATESSSNLVLYKILRLVRERFFSRAKEHRYYYKDAAEVNERAFARSVADRTRPLFLYLHYMDPHDPYFVHPYNGEAVARVHTPRPDAGQAGRLMRLYDGEVSYLDSHLGELFRFLKQHGLYESSLIVLTSDHGEEFYEHGGWWHGATLYEEQIHVPLIVKLPQQKWRGKRIEEFARSIDVAPTILAAAGIDVPRVMQGSNLLGHGDKGDGVKYVYAEEDFEGNVLKAIRGKEWKLILADEPSPRGLKAVELYHLKTDPRELEDRSSVNRNGLNVLMPELARLAEDAKKGSVVARQRKIDQAAKERLRMLGY